MPDEKTVQYPLITLDPTLPFLHPRAQETHKGSYGTLLLICGSYGMVGAAAMAARAALRCGVGLVNVVTRKRCYPLLAPMLPEAVFTVLDDDELEAFGAAADGVATPANADASAASPANINTTASVGNATDTHSTEPTHSNPSREKLLQALRGASACVIGCGLGADAAYYLPAVFAEAQCPLVVDADALNYLAQHRVLFASATAPLLVTPHPAEMARLCGASTSEVQADRVNTALSFAKEHNAITILKGAGTVVATPAGQAKINPTGNAGMAKGGSGDVLAGMLGAFLAQKIAPATAAEAAVYIHGAVGDICAKRLSQTAMQPTDMIEALPQFFLGAQRG